MARARLYFGAQGIVEPHVNGAVVDPSEVLDSSVTDYDARVLYRDFDVTRQLTQGRNALAFMAGKGQFAGQPTFTAQLDVTYTDGSTATFGTDPSWRTTAGPVTGDDFYYGESYDARRAVGGWDTAAYDDSGWAPAVAVAPAAHPQSLAQGRPVTALDTTTCCGWSPAALTDGVDGSTDASEGYHSAIADDAGHHQVGAGRPRFRPADRVAAALPGPADQRHRRRPARRGLPGALPGAGERRPGLRHRHDDRRPHRFRPAQPRHRVGGPAGLGDGPLCARHRHQALLQRRRLLLPAGRTRRLRRRIRRPRTAR